MNESMHGPTVVAALIRAAYEEGARNAATGMAAEMYVLSEAKKAAAQIVQNAGDPTLVERFFGLFRAWANTKEDDPMEAFKKAGKLMRQMRELVGTAPFDGGGNDPVV